MTVKIRKPRPPRRAASRADEPLLPESSILFGLVRVLNYLGREFDQKFAVPFDISIAEWRVLFVIGSYPGIFASQVASATGYSEMHVSRAVRQLLAKGEITRTPSAADRRRTELAVTPKGQRIYERMVVNTMDAERRSLSLLPRSEVARLRKIVAKLNAPFGRFEGR